MHLGPNLAHFLSVCQQLRDLDTLRYLLESITHAMGFEKFALSHHIDFAGPPSDAIVMMNYDEGWIETALERQYYLNDPIHVASAKCATGFLWRDETSLIALSKRQKEILAEASRFGLSDGYTVPIHIPGEYRGTCTFAGRSLEGIENSILGTAHLAGVFAFEGARRLIRLRRGEGDASVGIPSLSQRQLECVSLVAAGMGDCEIARVLNLSVPTVHQHIEEAMRRYGVAKRPQLVARALFDGQITYDTSRRR
jgi:LuxR family quorum-sensing system transcriptional regulator CciR